MYSISRITNIFLGLFFIALPCLSLFTDYLIADDLIILYMNLIIVIFCLFHLLHKLDRHICLTVTHIDILCLLYLIYCIFNAYYTRENEMPYIWRYTILNLVLGYLLIRSYPQKPIIINALIISGTLQSVIAILQSINKIHGNNDFFQITGTFQNPGPLGGFLGLSFIFTIKCFLDKKKDKRKFLLFIPLILMGYGLLLSDSRSAWIATFSVSNYILYKNIIRDEKIKSFFLKMKQSFIIKLLFMFICLSCLTITYLYKQNSANGRLLIWQTTTNMFLDKPLTGQGIGSFKETNILYQARYFEKNPHSYFASVAGYPGYPYNEFLHIASEQGVIGILFIGGILFLLYRLPQYHRIGKTALYGLSYLFLFSLFSYTFYIISLMFITIGLGGCLSYRPLVSFAFSKSMKIIAALCLLSILCVVISDIKIYKELRFISISSIHNHKELYDKIKNNSSFIDNYAQWAMITMPPDKRLPILRQAENVVPTVELFNDIGDTYLSLFNTNVAIQYYKKADLMIPNRITSKYKLFQIYLGAKDSCCALKWCEKALSGSLKIENTATLKMKIKMRQFKDIQLCSSN